MSCLSARVLLVVAVAYGTRTVGDVEAADLPITDSYGGSLQHAVSFADSFVAPVDGSIGPAAASGAFRVTVGVRRPRPLPTPGPDTGVIDRETFASTYGMTAADLAVVQEYAASHGLTVSNVNIPACTLTLSGTVAQHETAFAVTLEDFQTSDGVSYRAATGPPSLPINVAGVVTALVGLSEQPAARHYSAELNPNAASATPLKPPQVAQLYNFPAGTGAGQSVGIVELGGAFGASDLQKYFVGYLGFQSVPNVVAVSVDGHTIRSQSGDDVEVLLDIAVAGGVAPGANIVVYFADNTDAGFLDAFNAAIHDSTWNNCAVSCSWGSAETANSAASMAMYEDAFQAGVLLGVTLTAASGDSGSSDSGHSKTTDFPASGPHMLGVGGTTLIGSGSTISSETVWTPDSGGGISGNFPLPAYQTGLSSELVGSSPVTLPRRGVPDVAANGDPSSGYSIYVNGKFQTWGGTSAAAPLWAGLVAVLVEASGRRIGLMQNYVSAANTRDVTSGNNGAYAATTGWDACTGWGSPNGQALLATILATSQSVPPTPTRSPQSVTASITPTHSRPPTTTTSKTRGVSASASLSRTRTPSHSLSRTQTPSRSPTHSHSRAAGGQQKPGADGGADAAVTATASADVTSVGLGESPVVLLGSPSPSSPAGSGSGAVASTASTSVAVTPSQALVSHTSSQPTTGVSATGGVVAAAAGNGGTSATQATQATAGNATGAIVGGVIGAVFGVLLVALAVGIMWRRNQRGKSPNDVRGSSVHGGYSTLQSTAAQSSSSSSSSSSSDSGSRSTGTTPYTTHTNYTRSTTYADWSTTGASTPTYAPMYGASRY